jgi:glycosyltransferase involved in cell wall biosynthesis
MPRPLTLLHLVSLMGMGGRCATALRQCRLLAARGHTVLIGCLKGATCGGRALAFGATVDDGFHFRRGFRPFHFLGDCRRLARLCDTHRVDIVHAHLSQESWVACLGVSLVRRRPAVVRSRGVVVPIAAHAFNRWMHNRLTDRLIVPSDIIARHVHALPGFDPARVELIHDGVDTQRFNPQVDGSAVRAEFGIPANAPLAVMIARLERVKGHTVFFQALKALRDGNRVPGLRALCACDERTPGALEKTVREARELGLGEEILAFTGLRSDAEKIVAAADVLALPSLGSEGSSRVALEAAAGGRAIVASDAGCLPDVVLSGRTGLVVPRGQAAPLADGLATLLNDRALARNYGANARTRCEELFDEARMADRLEAVYRAVAPG